MLPFFHLNHLREVLNEENPREEEVQIIEVNVPRPPRFIRPRVDPFVVAGDRLFQKNVRLSKPAVQGLIRLLNPYLNVHQVRASSIPVQVKVLAALNFFATGSDQTIVGQSCFIGLTQQAVSQVVNEVVEALNVPEMFGQVVAFPATIQELNIVKAGFMEKHNFPRVVGCIDCTHVTIVPPPGNNPDQPEQSYLNRKGVHTINVQLVCDSNIKILNCNARFPGSSHDSLIWRQSSLQPYLEQLQEIMPGEQFLIGDSGYALRTTCLTPYENPAPGTAEERFNIAHRSTRSDIERCNGVLKARWRCLNKQRVLYCLPTKASKIINACVALHNICINYNVPFNEALYEEDVDNDNGVAYEEPLENNPPLEAGRALRHSITMSYFN